LLVERGAFDRNVATMAARWPGTRLRPHVKAFKSTALAKAARGERPHRVLLRHDPRDRGDGSATGELAIAEPLAR
jgi:hypothetical protein